MLWYELTQAIDTPIMLKNAGSFSLPPSSFYHSAETKIGDRAQGLETVPRTSLTVFAQKILRDVESGGRGGGGVVCRGKLSTVVLWLTWVLPGWAMVSGFIFWHPFRFEGVVCCLRWV